MNKTQKTPGTRKARRLAVAPMLATLLACGGSYALAGDLLDSNAVVVGQKRSDDLACTTPAIDSSRLTYGVQTDGQVDEDFVATAMPAEMSPAVLPAYVGQADNLLDLKSQISNFSAELFVSNLVNSSRLIEFVNSGDGLSYWELNLRPQTTPVRTASVAQGLAMGSNLFV